MDENLSLPPLPRHVLMPSMLEISDADIDDAGRWNPSMCRVCRGAKTYTGYKPGSTTEFVTYDCDCKSQLTLRRWFAVRGIPDIGMQLRWADMTGADQRWIDEATNFIEHRDAFLRVGQSMVFYGRSGSGKSSLAWLVMKAILWHGYHANAVSAMAIVDHLFMWKTDQERLDRWNRRMRNSDLLVIDDLGKEAGGRTESVARSVESLITRRADDRRSTLITTNLSAEQLTQRYPEAMEMLRGSGTLTEMSLADSWRDTDQRARNSFEVEHNIARPAVWG